MGYLPLILLVLAIICFALFAIIRPAALWDFLHSRGDRIRYDEEPGQGELNQLRMVGAAGLILIVVALLLLLPGILRDIALTKGIPW